MDVICFRCRGAIYIDEFENDNQIGDLSDSMWKEYNTETWSKYVGLIVSKLQQAGCSVIQDN